MKSPRNFPITATIAAAASAAMALRYLFKVIPDGARGKKGDGDESAKGGAPTNDHPGRKSSGAAPSVGGGGGPHLTPTPSDDELLQDDSRAEVEELEKYYGKYSSEYHMNEAAKQLLPFSCKEAAGRGILGFVRDADDDYRSAFDLQWVDLRLGVRIPFSSSQLRILHVDRQGGTGGGILQSIGPNHDSVPSSTVTIKFAVEKAAVVQQGKSAKSAFWGSAGRDGAFPLPRIEGYDPQRDYPDSNHSEQRAPQDRPPFLAAPTVDLSVEVAGVEELYPFVPSAGDGSALVVAEAAREALIARIGGGREPTSSSREPSDAGDSFVDGMEQEHLRITSKPTLSTVVKLVDGSSVTLDIPSLQCCYVVEKECLSTLPATGPGHSAVSSAASSVAGGSPASNKESAIISELRHVWYLFRASQDLRTVITVRMDSLAPEPPHPPSWFLNLARGILFDPITSEHPDGKTNLDKKGSTTLSAFPPPHVLLPSLTPLGSATSASSLFCCEPRHGFGFHVPLGFEAIPAPILVEDKDVPSIDRLLGFISRREGGERVGTGASSTVADGASISYAAHPIVLSPTTKGNGFSVSDWSEENLISTFFDEGNQMESVVGPIGPAIKRKGAAREESTPFLTLRSSFSSTPLRPRGSSEPPSEMDHQRIVIDAKYEHISGNNPWSVVIPRVLKKVAERFRLSDEGGIPFVMEGSMEALAASGTNRPLRGRGVSEPLLVMRSFVPNAACLTPGGAPRLHLLELPIPAETTSSKDDIVKLLLDREVRAVARAGERGLPVAALLASSEDVSARPTSRRSHSLGEGYFGAIDVLLKPPSASGGLFPINVLGGPEDSLGSGVPDVSALTTDGCQAASLCVYIVPVGNEFVSVTFVSRKTSRFRMKALLELSSFVMNSASIQNFHGQVPSVRLAAIPPFIPRGPWDNCAAFAFKVGFGVTVVEPRVSDPLIVLSVSHDGCPDPLLSRIIPRGWTPRVSKRVKKHADRVLRALFSLRVAPTFSPLPQSIVTIRTCPCPPRLCRPAIDCPSDISRLQLKSFAQECLHLIYNLGTSYTEWRPVAATGGGTMRGNTVGGSASMQSDLSHGRGSGVGSESGAGRSAGDGGGQSGNRLIVETGGGVEGGGHVVIRDVRAFPTRPRVLSLSLRSTQDPSMVVMFMIEHDHYLGVGDATEYPDNESIVSKAVDSTMEPAPESSARLATDGARLFLAGVQPSEATAACPANPFLWYLPPVSVDSETSYLKAGFPGATRHNQDGSPAAASRQSVTSAGKSTLAEERSVHHKSSLDSNWIRRVSAVVCVDNTAYIIQASTVNLSCTEQWASLRGYVQQVAASWVA